MATVGSVTVEVTPVLPKDATEQIETAVRAAIADALRKLADGLVATPTAAAADELSLWGYKVGDRVKYTAIGGGPEGWERIISRIDVDSLSLADPDTGDATGFADDADQIRPA